MWQAGLLSIQTPFCVAKCLLGCAQSPSFCTVPMQAARFFKTLLFIFGIFLSLAATVFATGQPRRYNENSTVKGTISQSFYQVNAKTDVAVKSIAVTGTLYEKGTFGTWQKISSCSITSASSSCSASSNYNTKPGKSYRLECSATFTYSNGQSETITSTASH